MKKEKFSIAVLGGGPGGYVAAIRAAQKNKTVALIEAQQVGGTCLNRGCIPSKSLIASAHLLHSVKKADQFGISTGPVTFDYATMKKQKDAIVAKILKGLKGLIASNHITLFQGWGTFTSPHEILVSGKEEILIEAEQIIIATGSESKKLPSCPTDQQRIHDSTSFLELTKLPKKLLVIGGGVIGCEFASLHHALGVDVTIVEMLPSILPGEAKVVAQFLTKSFQDRGIRLETNVTPQQIELVDNQVHIQLADGRRLEGDMALVCIGRDYNTKGIGLEKAGVTIEKNGAITTNAQMQTNVPHLYAIGDITGKWNYAHVASHQGIIAAENATGNFCEMHYNAIPSVIFTMPEMATTGYSLEKAQEKGYDAVVGKFPFQALGKAQSIRETQGFAQVVVDRETGQILGAQIIGEQATNLIAEITTAIENELTIESISETIHAHPTQAEAWMEAAFLAQGMPLHFPPKK